MPQYVYSGNLTTVNRQIAEDKFAGLTLVPGESYDLEENAFSAMPSMIGRGLLTLVAVPAVAEESAKPSRNTKKTADEAIA